MAKDLVLALCGGRSDFLASELGSEADCDDFFVAAAVSNAWAIYGNLERRHGGINDFDYSRCEHDFLGCYWQLLGDFLDKLPCQLSRS